MRSTIEGIIPPYIPPSASNNSQVSNPIYDATSIQELPWMLIGLAREKVPVDEDRGTVINFFTIPPETFRNNPDLAALYPLSPETIKNAIKALYEDTLDALSAKRNDVLHADPRFLFWEATSIDYSSVPNKRGVSPLMAINRILDYIKSSVGGGVPACVGTAIYPTDSTNQQKIIAETQYILCQIKEVLVEADGASYIDKLRRVYADAQLHAGEIFMENRIQSIIKLILNDHLKRNHIEIDQQQVLLLADNIVTRLGIYGSSNLSQVKLDILSALRNTENTLQNFAEIFAEGIAKTIEDVHQENKNDPLGERLIDKYCSLLFAIPDWQSKQLKDIDISLCEGRGLKSEWDQSLFKLKFSKKAFLAPFGPDRMCHFRRFLRQERFHQVYRNSGD